MKGFGDMKVIYKGITFAFAFFMLSLVGCDSAKEEININISDENVTSGLDDEKIEAVDDNNVGSLDDGEIEAAYEKVAEEQEMIELDTKTDVADVDFIKQILQEQVDFYLADIMETISINFYNENDIAEIQSFENNMVLDYKGDTYWMRPPNAEDEEGMDFDEPLGVYSKNDFKGNLDENEDYLFEYGLGGHVLKTKPYNYNISAIQYKFEGDELRSLRYYYMVAGIENIMTYEGFWDYDVVDSYESFDTSKMEDMNESKPYFWQEDNGDLNLIFNFERKEVFHHGYSEMKYNFSALCRCRYENEKYIVDEVIPLKMQ